MSEARAPLLAPQVLRYASVGVLVFAFDAALFMGLHGAGAEAWLAAAFSRTAGAAAGFFAHRRFTFGRADARGVSSEALRYAATFLAATALAVAIVHVSVDRFGGDPLAFRVIAEVITLTLTFLAFRLFVFAPRAGRVQSQPEIP